MHISKRLEMKNQDNQDGETWRASIGRRASSQLIRFQKELIYVAVTLMKDILTALQLIHVQSHQRLILYETALLNIHHGPAT